jgi:hypothetical protein
MICQHIITGTILLLLLANLMFLIMLGVGAKVYCVHSVVIYCILLFSLIHFCGWLFLVLHLTFLSHLCDWPVGCCTGKLTVKNWIELNAGVVSALTPAIS